MNLRDFTAALTRALSDEIRAREQEFAPHTMRALNLGAFPWHGYIEPSFLTSEDMCAERDIAAWNLYNFTSGRTANWPAVAPLSTWMQEFYERDRRANAPAIYAAAAEVLQSSAVQAALAHYSRSAGFYLCVFDPDDSSSKNYAAPRDGAAHF